MKIDYVSNRVDFETVTSSLGKLENSILVATLIELVTNWGRELEIQRVFCSDGNEFTNVFLLSTEVVSQSLDFGIACIELNYGLVSRYLTTGELVISYNANLSGVTMKLVIGTKGLESTQYFQKLISKTRIKVLSVLATNYSTIEVVFRPGSGVLEPARMLQHLSELSAGM